MRKKDGRVWAAVLRVDAAVEATAVLSDGSKPLGTLPSFPSLHPPPAPTLMIHPPPPAPLRLHHDSHPLPELNYRCGPLESSITLPPSSVIIKQVYELRPEPDCIEEPSSAVFMRLCAFFSHTPNSHTTGFDGTFAGRVFHLKMLECLQVMMQSRFSGGQCNSTGRTL